MKTNKLKATFGIAPTRPAMENGNHNRPARLAVETRRPELGSSEHITEVAARINVGFGNSLFIRGQGAGLSWDKGVPLVCEDASTWVWSTRQPRDKVTFKLLLNDTVWAQGNDVILEPGRRIELRPQF